MPQGVNAESITASSAKLKWIPVTGAKSYVLHYAVDDSDPHAAIYMHYTETPEFTLNDTVFNAPLTGKKLYIYIQSYNKTFAGADEIQQAQSANSTGNGSSWSDVLIIDFP
ncbi:hypothetical protein AWI85_06000 [Listeria monocytogenes]|uniref:hypothetical protein n=1 Tax=Listeria monocytogenes TaxID=1639 RepID=UPI000775853C|nr:hypothetical protein [Listeria monocytogenes]KXS79264.1 hypothetical protein AWI86_05290 [Listeria monocytogenes]KXS81552.1 hypothetical protein AWI85_06000 [Listeria monocytogenes]KXX12496.1 hypothetical protein AWI84_06220 [Listeria monocytogenes]KXX18714.1 hypothetical protein AWI83_06220 [Listeria monocytogenes]KXX21392.1 hypothetical protein AWI82_06220 [Listeria monocytogenes]